MMTLDIHLPKLLSDAIVEGETLEYTRLIGKYKAETIAVHLTGLLNDNTRTIVIIL